MSEEKKWKVYCYTNQVNGKKYIGITSTSLACRSGKNGIKYNECPFFRNAINKYGWKSFCVEVLRDNLTRLEASELEDYYIEFYNTRDSKNGYNIRPGGYTAHAFSEAGRKSFIESHSGKNAHHARRTSVYDLNGNLVKTFDTGADAAKYLDVSDVSEVCKSRRGTLAGHIIRYESDFNGIARLPPQEIYTRYDYRLLYKAVNQYSLDGKYLKTFSSTKEAAAEVTSNKSGKSAICGCLKGRQRSAYGFMWRYADGNVPRDIDSYKEYHPKHGQDLPQSICVRQLTVDGELVAVYSSIREAHLSTGVSASTIRRHLAGTVKNPVNYIWEQAE